MMRWGRIAAAACIGMLCLLLFSCLVLEENAAPAEPEQRMPMNAVLELQRCAIPAENAAPTADRRVQDRYVTTADALQHMQQPRAAQRCDGNGWVITGRTWPRTVYVACPPEAKPG